MEHVTLQRLLNDEDDIKLLLSLANDKLDKPVLICKIIDLLSDGNKIINSMNEARALSLFRLAKEYFNVCWGIYLDASMGGTGLDKLIQYSENIIYHVYAPNGLRVATVNEVKNGVEELVAKTTQIFTEEEAEYLNLLLWTFNGQLRYYKKAGLSYKYTNGKLDDTDYQLVCRAGQKLRGMIDWLSIGGNYERAIASLKLAKKASKYKYPTFAQDETTCEISPKQIIYLCKTKILGKGITEAQTETKRILFKIDKDNYKPLPHDIACMRKAYSEVLNGVVDNPYRQMDNTIADLCKRLEDGLKNGLLDKNNFAFKILDTVKKSGRCSDKQLAILLKAGEDLQDIINKNSKTKKLEDANNSDESMQELLQLSEALGTGALEGK